MAGLAAAWRLSEPQHTGAIRSVTVYQRGWRLGGKGASSRGPNGRIEEHGLHLWLGYYENAFRLLRECYSALDRPATDPGAPIGTWDEALLPVDVVGLEDLRGEHWHHWLGRFSPNDLLPGEPDGAPATLTPADVLSRALRLVLDFLDSLPDDPPATAEAAATGLRLVVLSAVMETAAQVRAALDRTGVARCVATLDRALEATRAVLAELVDEHADLRRTWHLVAVMTAVVRGILADGVLTHHRGFRALNDEDFLDWIMRHGAAPEVRDFAFIRGLYDLVFADADEATRARGGVSAGVAVFLTTKMFFEYRGAIFWRMAAGMGDVVFAPLYQALRARGVRFEFFHRVDDLLPSDDGRRIAAVRLGRQAELAPGRERYDPLTRVGGLPAFPSRPDLGQLDAPPGLADQPLESHFCAWPDAAARELRDSDDFDAVVLAVSLGIVPVVCRRLIDQRAEWAAMVDRVPTTATQALQLWIREPEPALGWAEPGTTVSAYAHPFHTWASMPQLIDRECWPAAERPGAIAYFCGALDAPWPADRPAAAYVAAHRAAVRQNAVELVEERLGHLLPASHGAAGFRWELLCGRNGHRGRAAIDTQLCLANIDPSDRYVRCAPGSDAFRLRADESGYDNLVLAGDWTDNGVNAGCIEAAVMSGLQAANAVLGRSRMYRIAGSWPD